MDPDRQPNVNTDSEQNNEPVSTAPVAPQVSQAQAIESEPTTSDPTTATSAIPVVPVSGSRSNNRPKFFIIILAVIVALFIGGSVAAYNLWYQNPNKVLGDGVMNLFTETKPVSTNGTLAINGGGATGDITFAGASFEGSSSGDATIKVTMSEGPMKGKVISLKGSGVYMNDGAAYFKLSDVKQAVDDIVTIYIDTTVSQYKSMGYKLSDAEIASVRSMVATQVQPIVAKLDNQWIKVSAEELKGDSDESAKQYACLTDVTKQIRNEKNLKELGDVYKKNQFVTITKQLGVKDGSYGYELSVDAAKAKEFGKQTENTAIAKAFTACDDSDTKSTVSSAEDTADTTKTKTFQVWVSRWTHRITHVVYEGETTGTSDDATTVKIDTKLDYDKKVTIAAPSDAKSIKEITKELETITGSAGSV